MVAPLADLIDRAPWREAVTYRDAWPHEYVLTDKDNQRELLDVICSRFRAGEGVACRFFRMNNTYLFIGDYKYWLMTDYNDIDPYNDARRLRDKPRSPILGPPGLHHPAGRYRQARGLPR